MLLFKVTDLAGVLETLVEEDLAYCIANITLNIAPLGCYHQPNHTLLSDLDITDIQGWRAILKTRQTYDRHTDKLQNQPQFGLESEGAPITGQILRERERVELEPDSAFVMRKYLLMVS